MGGPRSWRRRAALLLSTVAVVAPVAPTGALPVTGVAPAAPLSPPVGDIPDLAAAGWQAVFADDFNGSAVDESVWEIQEGPGQNGPGMMTRDAITVSGGVLTMRGYTTGTTHHSAELQTGEYNAGQSSSFLSTYGYYETRARLKTEPGNAHAFWMLSKSTHLSPYGDPGATGTELDVFEHNDPNEWDDSPDDNVCDWTPAHAAGKPCSEVVGVGKHWDGFEESHKPEGSPVLNPTATPLEGNWHEYGMLWTPQGARFYIDGKEVHRSTNAVSYQPEYLILSQFVGGWQGAPPDPDGPGGNPPTYGAKNAASNPLMEVDYVKVWQRPISDVPNRTAPANRPVTMPFSVLDHFTPNATTKVPAALGSVRVSATSSNTTLVPNANITVSGNGSAFPSGSGANGSFESGTAAPWTLTGGASVVTTAARTGTKSLRLVDTGGQAEQVVTGLQPNTKYRLGLWTKIMLEWTDTNANGRVDAGETVSDGSAAVDVGVRDVDSARSGAQTVVAKRDRQVWQDLDQPWSPAGNWVPYDVDFTTGPTTTQVTLFADNTAYTVAPLTAEDSNLWVDDVYLQQVVPPDRSVTVRPADGQTGTTTVTLTAVDAAGTTVGTETFTVTFRATGTFTNGDFETLGGAAGSAPAGWTLADGSPGRGADIVVDNPFTLDRVLELADVGIGTATQRVTGLVAGQAYNLQVTGKGDLGVVVNGHGNPQVSTTITSATWTPGSVNFTMGAASTTADVLLIDWNTGNGRSWADDVTLTPALPAGNSVPAVASPSFLTLGAQVIPSNAPTAINFSVPTTSPATTITGVTSVNTGTAAQRSANAALLPDRNLTYAVNGTNGVLGIRPTPDRTGRATITIRYNVGSTPHTYDIPIVVTDTRLENGGFEEGNVDWAASTGNPTIVGGGQQRTGAGALSINGTATVKQTVHLHDHTAHLFRVWTKGNVTAEVRATATGELLNSAAWTGASWTENTIAFTTPMCAGCQATQARSVDLVLKETNTGDATAVLVDDVTLGYRPRVHPLRDISIHEGQTTADWETDRTLRTGRMPQDAFWDTTMRSVTVSDLAGFGTGVVPIGQTSLAQPVPTHAQTWRFRATSSGAATQKTGRTRVTVQLTDPATGQQVSRTFDVTVNAGDNFRNGDFQANRGSGYGWSGAWLNNSWAVVDRNPIDGVPETSNPRDVNQALRISSGAAKTTITGLAPSTSYTVKLRARGNQSTAIVRTHDNIVFAPVLGQVDIAPPDSSDTWRDYSFTFTTTASGNGSTGVVLYLVDDDLGDANGDGTTDHLDAVAPSATPCSDGNIVDGETCFDDIGVFKTSDL